jgi:hypothetical protein
MSRSPKICCDEVAPQIGRRSVLAGLAGMITLAPLARAHAKGEVGLADLVGSDGRPSDFARSKVGQTISVRGYLAPSLDGFEFALSEASPGVCQLCGATHDPGRTMTIRSSSAESSLPTFELVQVEGRLTVPEAVDTMRLLDAKVRAF